MTSPDRLDIVPERVLDPVRRPSVAARFGTALGDGVLSFVLNAAVVGWLIQLGWPLRSSSPASDPISVEIVDHVPGETSAGAGGEPRKAAAEPQAAIGKDTSDQPTAQSTAADPKPLEPVPEKPPMPPEPSQQAAAQPPVQPSQPPTPPEEPAAPPPSPSEDLPNPATPPTTEPQPTGTAVPPPPEHPNNDARPQLVEAPKPPGPPAPESETRPVITPPQSAGTTPAATESEAPQLSVTTPPDPDAIPLAPAQPPKKPPELTADQKRQAENTAKLAAMLPLSQSISANPFQGGTTGQDSGTSQAYRGAVYGTFAKARDVVEAAQAQHLRGQAVVAFSLDDQGGIATLGIAVSSGHPEVDKAALDYIRHSAPFPPPPPGAQRSFSPAIGFGLDE